jgi:hypothetical protein
LPSLHSIWDLGLHSSADSRSRAAFIVWQHMCDVNSMVNGCARTSGVHGSHVSHAHVVLGMHGSVCMLHAHICASVHVLGLLYISVT